ncbi:MAG TPA: TonB family protein, partial [Bdellovibrionales bacterium]|nr:TonB family protein [Bdellovibrionales bacterium]
MRSTFFVLFSVLVHALAVAAIAFAPRQISEPSGHEIEVQVGENADQPGLENTDNQAPSVATAPPTPAPKAEEVRKPTPAPAPKKAPAPPVEVTEESVPVEQDPLPEQLSSEIEPVTPVATATPTEEPTASIEEAQAEPAAPAAAVGRAEEHEQEGELGKGGATQEGAVTYTELKQVSDNKMPFYPIAARRERREGQLELLYRVTKEGTVADMQIAQSSGHKDLDQEAVRAISKFRFVPGQEGWARHPVSFALKGQEEALPG